MDGAAGQGGEQKAVEKKFPGGLGVGLEPGLGNEIHGLEVHRPGFVIVQPDIALLGYAGDLETDQARAGALAGDRERKIRVIKPKESDDRDKDRAGKPKITLSLLMVIW